MRAYAGYTYLLLGEGMCNMTIDGGPLMTRAQTLAIAEQRFSDAITAATAINDKSLLNMALVGRARTRLDLGNLPGAATDAAAVTDTTFVRVAEFSETTQSRENRIYDRRLQERVFQILGLDQETIEQRFGFLLEAFEFGVPPHGGIAPGLDRIVMMLAGTDNIRDVIAFPKTQSVQDLMLDAPSAVETAQLDELGIMLKPGIKPS